jgi:23S rRNA (adenine2503-C2)-methyltransferase
MGLVRHLTAGEIVSQVRVLAHETGLAGTPFNIVFMGMGEPLHNYDATMKAIRMLADEQGLAVHPRRMTLSTVGLIPALERLADEPLMPNLRFAVRRPRTRRRSCQSTEVRTGRAYRGLPRFPLAKRRASPSVRPARA